MALGKWLRVACLLLLFLVWVGGFGAGWLWTAGSGRWVAQGTGWLWAGGFGHGSRWLGGSGRVAQGGWMALGLGRWLRVACLLLLFLVCVGGFGPGGSGRVAQGGGWLRVHE